MIRTVAKDWTSPRSACPRLSWNSRPVQVGRRYSTGDLASKRSAGDILAITPDSGGVSAMGTAVRSDCSQGARGDVVGDDRMKGFSSTPAQIVTAFAATVALLYFFRGVLAPFFLAAVIIVVIHAIADFIVGLLPKVPRWIAIVLSGVVLSALIIASFDIALHGLAELVPRTQQMALRLQELLQVVGSAVGVAEVPGVKVLLGTADLSGLIQSTLTSLTGALSSVGLVILFLAFFLASRPTLNSKVAVFAASSSREMRISAVLKQVDRGVRDCVLAQTVTAALIAGGACAVMLLVGLDNSIFLGVAIFLISYIPVLGGLASSIAPALFALVQFPTIWQAVAVFLAIQSINIAVGNFVLPKMQASRQNVDPAIGILAFSVWSLLWGIPGAILAYPLTLTLMIAFAQFERTRWIAVLISNDGKPAASVDAEAEVPYTSPL
jgi:predicted PurR-regulated permease PerM